MTIQEQIDALPAWPTNPMHPALFGSGTDVLVRAAQRHQADQLHAALARLALAREWIAQTHTPDCGVLYGASRECDCGRDALLAALEPPK